MVSNKSCSDIFMLLFIFSCLLSLHAPMALSRAIEFKSEKLDAERQEITQKSTFNQIEIKELNIKGRMDIETDDYPYMAANNRHMPRNPGPGRS